MCYNNIRGSVYTFTRVGAITARERKIRGYRLLGILLGVCCWFMAVLGSTDLVFKVDVVGTTVYEREAVEILRESGVSVFKAYPKNKEGEMTARILDLEGVEFCSVQKYGNTVRVEIRQSPLPQAKREEGDLICPRTCILENVVSLSGTLLKKAGEEVLAGESIVGGYFIHADGVNKSETSVVAKAKLLCVEEFIEKKQEDAVFEAVLFVESLGGEIRSITIEETEDGVKAKAEFTLVIKKNM